MVTPPRMDRPGRFMKYHDSWWSHEYPINPWIFHSSHPHYLKNTQTISKTILWFQLWFHHLRNQPWFHIKPWPVPGVPKLEVPTNFSGSTVGATFQANHWKIPRKCLAARSQSLVKLLVKFLCCLANSAWRPVGSQVATWWPTNEILSKTWM